ncbi:hypothetical protein Hanom_Chr07g00627131 [Helianthus anomalus]
MNRSHCRFPLGNGLAFIVLTEYTRSRVAAKEFETELKKEPETLGESSDATAVNEQEPEESKVPTTKDSL